VGVTTEVGEGVDDASGCRTGLRIQGDGVAAAATGGDTGAGTVVGLNGGQTSAKANSFGFAPLPMLPEPHAQPSTSPSCTFLSDDPALAYCHWPSSWV
jgi:glycine/D-amino acid oxidase-like deaminating enzyme